MTDEVVARRVRVRRALMYPLAFVLVACAWELYKWVGPAKGGEILGMRLLARTDDRAMPHVWKMVQRLGRPEVRVGDDIWLVVTKATWYSFRVALAAFLVGVLLGMMLAVVMARFKLAERALMPYLAISQTVPIIVLAPLLAVLILDVNKDWVDAKWMPVMALGVFLAFFPVAVSTLKGLQSTNAAALELMDSYAAGWWKTLFKLRFPSAVPYILPGLRLAGASAVVGVVVAEISTGVRFGVGRLVLSYGQEATSDPPKLYSAVFGAAVLGLVMAALVVGLDRLLRRNLPPESA